MTQKPAVSLAAVPGRRKATLELAQRIEAEGFSGIYCPSFGDGLGLCEALALVTKEIPFGTSIANIYTRHPFDYAQTASLVHELSGGRFVFGIGVSHGPAHQRLGLRVGKPLSDMQRFVERLRAASQQGAGELPPIVLATLRKKMVALAAEIADGCVWANGARSHMAASLAVIPPEKRDGLFVADMIPTCIDEDRNAAAAVMRRVLTGYVALPNYRNYWIEAGYEEEMRAIEAALAKGEQDRVPSLMSDRWLADVTLFGSAKDVRDGVEAWYAAGVKTPILVPSSTRGRQMKAFEELFEAFR